MVAGVSRRQAAMKSAVSGLQSAAMSWRLALEAKLQVPTVKLQSSFKRKSSKPVNAQGTLLRAGTLRNRYPASSRGNGPVTSDH